MGVLIGNAGSLVTGFSMRNDRLILSAMNDARNKAAAWGVTHLVLGAPQLGSSEGTTTTATFVANAFRCSGDETAPEGAVKIGPAPAQ